MLGLEVLEKPSGLPFYCILSNIEEGKEILFLLSTSLAWYMLLSLVLTNLQSSYIGPVNAFLFSEDNDKHCTNN